MQNWNPPVDASQTVPQTCFRCGSEMVNGMCWACSQTASADPVGKVLSLERLIDEIKRALLATDYVIQGEEHEPNLVARAKQLIAERASLRAQLTAATQRAEKSEGELVRTTDLVRYMRAELHEADLITDEEYAQLCAIGGSPARLETYDQLRADKEKAEAACAEWRNAVETIREHVLHDRGPLAEMDMDSDRTNAVLAIIDDHTPDDDCGKGCVSKDDLIQIRVELESVLCDPQGQPCFVGSDDDRQFVAHALARLQKLTEAK